MPRPSVPGVRWTTPEQWHVTLRFLGSAPFDLSAVREWPAVRPVAVMRPAAERLGRDVLCLPVDGLDSLAAAVDPAPERPFRGHLTLARRRSGRLPLGVGLVDPEPVSWEVGEVTLVSSRLLPSGAEYEVVDRVPL